MESAYTHNYRTLKTRIMTPLSYHRTYVDTQDILSSKIEASSNHLKLKERANYRYVKMISTIRTSLRLIFSYVDVFDVCCANIHQLI
jgi:hypothetical protein